MGDWYNVRLEKIPVSEMSDVYINNLIGFVARGGGWNAEIVLGFVDDLYEAAKERKILKGPIAWVLKRYAVRLWKKISKSGGERYAWKTPKWVEKALEKHVPKKDYNLGEQGGLAYGE